MPRSLSHAARGSRTVVAVALVGGFSATVWAGLSATRQAARLPDMFGAGWLVFALLAVGALVHVAALVRVVRGRIGGGRTLRNGFCTAGLTWLVALLLLQPFDPFRSELAIAFGSTAFAGGVAGLPAGPARKRFVAIAELVVFNLFLTVVLAELGLAALARWSPSPLLMVDDSSVPQRMAALARPIGKPHLGFPTNSLGHYDAEFVPRENRKRTTIAMIGDSFSASFVPHHYQFTTVAERELHDVDVYNFGISGIGPYEYLHLLVHQVLPLEPDAVLVGVFAGNDLANVNVRGSAGALLWPWFNRRQVRLCTVTERLSKLAAERERGYAASPGAAAEGLLLGVDELAASYPWLHDHRLERGTFSAKAYLELVQKRIKIACAPPGPRLSEVMACLDKMRVAVGERPFGVVLLPAEFQVEDELWRRAVTPLPLALDRDEPQASLSRLLAESGIATLDLLPTMRATPPLADGDRHLYLLRDTHFNVRGNDLAGREIAAFVRGLLGR